MRVPHIIVAAWLVLLCATVASQAAEKRVALVVGNAAYRHAGVPKLDNPVNDAQGLRDALKKLGFEVIYGENLDLKGFGRAIGQFAGHVEDADVAIVYFAGHGATFDGVSYVVPVDAEFASLTEVPHELVPVETLIGDLRRAKGVRIAVLDACRDNGAEQDLKRQASRGGDRTRGLAPMKNPSGLIIAYATQYGATAADSGASAPGGLFSWLTPSAQHSPFTAALLDNIATPGLDVTEMFRKVGRDVSAATGGKQRPEISISMYDQYALAPAARDVQTASAITVPARPVPPQQTAAAPAVPPDSLAPGPAKTPADQQMAAVAPPVKPAVPDHCNGAKTVSSTSRCAAPLTVAQERALKPKDSFTECENCPEMVVLPAGSFTMGLPVLDKNYIYGENPEHVVRISNPFAVGKVHVTVDQFAAFVRETGYEADSECVRVEQIFSRGSWRDPGFAQDGSHPVLCVTWNDAVAYAKWLGQKTGKLYRLLSEAEWEYAARGRTTPGSYPRFWFGNSERDLCQHGNFFDQKARAGIKTEGMIKTETTAPCNDGYIYTSPTGHYKPNAFGLHDMFGNAEQWTIDCWHSTYDGAPADGSAWTSGCTVHLPPLGGRSESDAALNERIFRGGGWFSNAGLPTQRNSIRKTAAANDRGFRVARTIFP